MDHLKRKEGGWDGARIIGGIFILFSIFPLFTWSWELGRHVFTEAPGDFNPALDPGDLWLVVFGGLGVGLGLLFGKGRELTNALIDRIKGSG